MVGRRGLVVVLATLCLGGVAAVAGAAGTSAGADAVIAAVRLADGSAGCNVLASGAVACRGETAEPALLLEPDGRSHAADVVVSWDARTPVLLPGESWWNGPFTCRVNEGLACAAVGGGRIVVAADAVAARPRR